MNKPAVEECQLWQLLRPDLRYNLLVGRERGQLFVELKAQCPKAVDGVRTWHLVKNNIWLSNTSELLQDCTSDRLAITWLRPIYCLYKKNYKTQIWRAIYVIFEILNINYVSGIIRSWSVDRPTLHTENQKVQTSILKNFNILWPWSQLCNSLYKSSPRLLVLLKHCWKNNTKMLRVLSFKKGYKVKQKWHRLKVAKYCQNCLCSSLWYYESLWKKIITIKLVNIIQITIQTQSEMLNTCVEHVVNFCDLCKSVHLSQIH